MKTNKEKNKYCNIIMNRVRANTGASQYITDRPMGLSFI